MKISVSLFFTLFLCLVRPFAQQNSNVPVTYYREQGEKFEEVPKLPRDTVHDTVLVSDIDAFLKQYGCNLRSFVKKYGSNKHLIDSLNHLTGERLYYNFFMPANKEHRLSTRYIIRTFRVKEDSIELEKATASDVIELKKPVREEVLFVCRGTDQTDRFLKNPSAIIKTISGMFTEMQKMDCPDTTRIKGINLYFPDFTFHEKRAMVQFVKSVRIMMEASRYFTTIHTRLNVTFLKPSDKDGIDTGFLYSLKQEATEVICLDENTIDSCYVKGIPVSLEQLNIGLMSQIISHFYIARYYTGSLDIMKGNLTDFSEKKITPYLQADSLDNTWELFLFPMILSVLVMMVLVILYYTFLPFSTIVNKHIEMVVLSGVMMLLELLALSVTAFQHMCKDDGFSQLQKHPLLIFSLPLLAVLIIPLLRGVSKKRRMP